MGFNSDVISKAWRETMPDAFKTTTETPYMALPNPRPSRNRTWISDQASWLYFLSSPFSNTAAKTFGDWLDQARARITHYLKDLSVHRIVIMLDCYSDPAKRYLRRRDNSEKRDPEGKVIRKAKPVPLTPPNGFRQFLIAESERYHDNLEQSLPRTADGDLRDIDIVLPGTWPGSQFAFTNYLDNGDFKNHFFIPLVCRNLHIGLQVPYGKEVLFRGPNTAWLARNTGLVEPIPAPMKAQFGEPDAFVGYWMTLWPEDDFLVESSDGDVLTSLLLTSSLRQKPNHSGKAVLEQDHIFKNQVTLMRNQWDANRANTVIDINRLWLDMFQQCSALNCENLAQIRNPIADQVVLAYLSGDNDFIDSTLLPKIGTISLFECYYVYILAWPTGLVLPHIVDGRYVGFHVDITALSSFIICCYQLVYKKLPLDHSDPEASLQLIRSRLAEVDIYTGPRMETVRELAVQLSWTLNYYSNGCYGVPVPRSTERSKGRSKYGWIKDPATGDIVPTSDVDTRWLLDITHPGWRPKDSSLSPGPSPFRAPKPDSYNQLDPVLTS